MLTKLMAEIIDILVNMFGAFYSWYHEFYTHLLLLSTYVQISDFFVRHDVIRLGEVERPYETRYLDIFFNLPITFCKWITTTVNVSYGIDITPQDVLEKLHHERFTYISNEMSYFFNLDDAGRKAYKEVYGIDYTDVLSLYKKQNYIEASTAPEVAGGMEDKNKGSIMLIVVIILSLGLFSYLPHH